MFEELELLKLHSNGLYFISALQTSCEHQNLITHLLKHESLQWYLCARPSLECITVIVACKQKYMQWKYASIYTCRPRPDRLISFFFFYLCLYWTYHWLRQSDMLLLRHTHNSTLDVQPPVKELHISCKCLPVNIPFSRGFDHVHNCTHTTATGHMDVTMLLYKVLCTYCFAKIKFDWFLNEWQQILSFFIYTFEFSCAVSAVTTCVA